MNWKDTIKAYCPSHESDYTGTYYCKLLAGEGRVEDRLCLEKNCTPYWWAVTVIQNYPR